MCGRDEMTNPRSLTSPIEVEAPPDGATFSKRGGTG